jgi:hypothetical protein
MGWAIFDQLSIHLYGEYWHPGLLHSKLSLSTKGSMGFVNTLTSI